MKSKPESETEPQSRNAATNSIPKNEAVYARISFSAAEGCFSLFKYRSIRIILKAVPTRHTKRQKDSSRGRLSQYEPNLKTIR